MFTLALSFKINCHTLTWSLSFKGICHTFTWALSFKGSVGSDEIGFMLLSSDLAYSLSVFSRRRYRSRWKVRCIADKVKQRSLMLIRGSMDCNTDHIKYFLSSFKFTYTLKPKDPYQVCIQCQYLQNSLFTCL